MGRGVILQWTRPFNKTWHPPELQQVLLDKGDMFSAFHIALFLVPNKGSHLLQILLKGLLTSISSRWE